MKVTLDMPVGLVNEVLAYEAGESSSNLTAMVNFLRRLRAIPRLLHCVS